jgi:hypothetical protein
MCAQFECEIDREAADGKKNFHHQQTYAKRTHIMKCSSISLSLSLSLSSFLEVLMIYMQ